MSELNVKSVIETCYDQFFNRRLSDNHFKNQILPFSTMQDQAEANLGRLSFSQHNTMVPVHSSTTKSLVPRDHGPHSHISETRTQICTYIYSFKIIRNVTFICILS